MSVINPMGMPVTSLSPGVRVVMKGWQEPEPVMTIIGQVQGGGLGCSYWSEKQDCYLTIVVSAEALEFAPDPIFADA